MDDVLKSMRAVSDELRVRILLLLTDREACVCELMAVFGLAQSRLSHHLRTLHAAGFLKDEKRGRWNYYRVHPASLDGVNRSLVQSLRGWFASSALVERDRTALKRAKQRLHC
ncbi:MAG TPA: metalloregulator ArsR/SmtB family transcription factor [Bacteroidota bacterium]|nr:metalloregulator ArsR/SmtB family transcription factor [Bacteroidota bacterium]